MTDVNVSSSDMPSAPATVRWGLVATYYAIAFCAVSALAAVLGLLGAQYAFGKSTTVFQLVIAFLYMPMPLVAALITERIGGVPTRVIAEFRELPRRLPRVVLVTVAVSVAIFGAEALAVLLAGNLLHLPGVGRLALSQADVVQSFSTLFPGKASAEMIRTMPPLPALYALMLFGGITAGLTVNGLFAFGEEYGWRGFLADLLAPLGPVRANLLTAVMWGLWHAPIILLGFNYGADRALGIVMMCLWLTPLSFILSRAREFTGSVWPAAMIHGAFNGFAGTFVLLSLGARAVWGVPVGLTSFVALSALAIFAPRLLRPAH